MAELNRGWKWWFKGFFACYALAVALFLIQLVIWFPLSERWEQAPYPFDYSGWFLLANMAIVFPVVYKRLR